MGVALIFIVTKREDPPSVICPGGGDPDLVVKVFGIGISPAAVNETAVSRELTVRRYQEQVQIKVCGNTADLIVETAVGMEGAVGNVLVIAPVGRPIENDRLLPVNVRRQRIRMDGAFRGGLW